MGTPNSKLTNGRDSTELISSDIQKSSLKKNANTREKILTSLSKNSVVVWLDPNLNDSDIVYKNSITRLQRISVPIHTFTKINDCIQFLNKMKDSKILMVIADHLIKDIWPQIGPMTNVHSVYILSNDNEKKEYSEKEFDKIKGIFTKVDPIYGSLKRDTRQYKQDILVMSIIPSGKYTKNDLKQLNQLFIYWFLVKQIILEIKYDQEEYKELAEFSRSHYTDNNNELKIIDEFEKNYHSHSPIWWYTQESFIHVMLNRALQTQDIEVIIKMGSFIQDLHRQLEQLYSDAQKMNETSKIVYRSQNTSRDALEKIKTSQGCILSFNNFLLADSDYKTSLEETRRVRINADAIGLLFRIEIEFTQTSTPCASLENISYSPEQGKYYLFSMHSVFRIGEIKEIEDRVWQIDLTLIEVNDKQMISLTELMGEISREAGWYKLAKLIIALHDYDHAKEIYFVLLDLLGENDLLKMSHIYNELGLLSDEMGDYSYALSCYQKAIELRQKCLPPNHRSLSIAYNNIGEAQRELGEYFNALSSQQKALSMKQKTLPPNDLSFATTYNNLGLANESLGEYSTALEFYNKALEIKRKVLPSSHHELAITYNNMGELQREMGNFSSALNYFEKVLNIRLKSASTFESSLAITYNNIGLIHREMGDYSKAVEYFQKSLEVKEKTFTINHPSLAVSYNNIGDLNQQMGEYSNALLSYQKALEIQEKAFSVNHPELATTYNNVGVAHQSMGSYSIALSFYQKALKIRQKSLPANHPALGTSYNNIGHVNQLMGDYNTALEYYQKTQKLQEKSLRPNHPSIATTLNNIADIQSKLGNFKSALVLYKKSLEIKKKSLSPNHPTLLTTYNNIGVIHQLMNEHSSALECYKKTLEIQEKTLSAGHPDLAAVYNNIGVTHQSLKEYSIALENYKKALAIQEKNLTSNHPDIATTHNSMATAYVGLGDLKNAVEHEQIAVDIATKALGSDHPNLQTFQNYLERIRFKIDSNETA